MDENSEHQVTYPVSLLANLSEDLGNEIERYIRAYRLPKAFFKAVIEYATLSQLLEQYDHAEEFQPDGLPGYNREIEGAVRDSAWLIDEVGELAREQFKQMSPEDQQAAQNYDLYD